MVIATGTTPSSSSTAHEPSTASHIRRITDPLEFAFVVHGAPSNCWDSIRAHGLKPMAYEHVYLAPHVAYIRQNVSNADCFIYVDLASMITDGAEVFYDTNAGYIFTTGMGGNIPPRYFVKVVQQVDGAYVSLWPAATAQEAAA
jgi:RNA:NAD 2'-phosphotransferase (TPT1/KptA family)